MRAVDNGGRVRASVALRAGSQARGSPSLVSWLMDQVSAAEEEFKGLGGVSPYFQSVRGLSRDGERLRKSECI